MNKNIRSRLEQAIADAFPTWDSLQRLVAYGLNMNLRNIVESEDLFDSITELVDWAIAFDKLSDLLAVAITEQPNSAEFKALEMLLKQEEPSVELSGKIEPAARLQAAIRAALPTYGDAEQIAWFELGLDLSKIPSLNSLDDTVAYLCNLTRTQDRFQTLLYAVAHFNPSNSELQFALLDQNIRDFPLTGFSTRVRYRQAHAALLEAFPRWSELARLVWIEFGEDLNAIAPKGTLSDITFALIRWAVSHNQLGELIAAAIRENSDNPVLRQAQHDLDLMESVASWRAIQLRQLWYMTLESFPSREDLENLARRGFGRMTPAIAMAANLGDMAFELIREAVEAHRLRQLLRVASSLSINKQPWLTLTTQLEVLSLSDRQLLGYVLFSDTSSRHLVPDWVTSRPPASGSGPSCPYPGMKPFLPEDVQFFYGRSTILDEIILRLRYSSFLLISGDSGCGKSSLIQAGLLPRIRQQPSSLPGPWEAVLVLLQPGVQPLIALALALDGDPSKPQQVVDAYLAAHRPAQRLLLAVDQLEEAFSHAQQADQTLFFDLLRSFADQPHCSVVATLRADFLRDLFASELAGLAAPNHLRLPPLSGNALRDVIAGPAQKVGVEIDPALVERLAGFADNVPGALPLLQETLVMLWNRVAEGRVLLAAYEELGVEHRSGLGVVISHHADAVLQKLDPAQRMIARRIFLRLVQFGEGRPDTRRQQAVADLQADDDNPEVFTCTLAKLINNRLLTATGNSADPNRRIDLAHEILITEWQTLANWVQTYRSTAQQLREWEGRAVDWRESGKRPRRLLEADELVTAQAVLAGSDAKELGVSLLLHSYLVASAAQEDLSHGKKHTKLPSSSETTPIDIGVVFALPEEFAELYEEIESNHAVVTDPTTGNYYYRFEHPVGDISYRCVTTFAGEMGSTKTGLITQQLIQQWAPTTLIMVGIAGGISSDVHVGDVVVATVVDAFIENAKAIPKAGGKEYEFSLSGEPYRSSKELVTLSHNFPFAKTVYYRAWQEQCARDLGQFVPAASLTTLLEGGLVQEQVNIARGPIASGPIVSGAAAFTSWLLTHNRKYLAIEMEAAGLLAAVNEEIQQRRTLILRGISDYGDARKKKLDRIGKGALRRYAVRNAIHLLWAFLDAQALPR